jgi:cytochrome c oxidase subunit II
LFIINQEATLFQQASNQRKRRQVQWLRAPSWWVMGLGLATGLVTSCVEAPASRTTPSALDAHGTGAAIIRQEWWFLFWIGTAIVLLVTGLLVAILVRQWQNRQVLSAEVRDTDGIKWIWLGGIALPIVIALFVFASTIRSSLALSAPPGPETVTVTIIGHRWWWEVQYPDEAFTTANQLYLPVGQSVRVNITSADVIHSFWVPQLGFKRDLIPGQMNETWLQANEPGVYRGLCSEFCGLQHAQMMFMVVALTPKRYQAVMANERKLAPAPNNELARAGQQVFLRSSCVYCHTIRGTSAAGEVGPDLTHLANRLTIAAGALENNVGNLGGWIMDPQHIKPGSTMPATPLTGKDLQALLAYLRTLQ